jgi:phosphoribosylanthranilate isomerase
VEAASCAIAAGANLIGVIFAASKRQASPEQASVKEVGTWLCVRQEKGTQICDFMVMFNGI